MGHKPSLRAEEALRSVPAADDELEGAYDHLRLAVEGHGPEERELSLIYI